MLVRKFSFSPLKAMEQEMLDSLHFSSKKTQGSISFRNNQEIESVNFEQNTLQSPFLLSHDQSEKGFKLNLKRDNNGIRQITKESPNFRIPDYQENNELDQNILLYKQRIASVNNERPLTDRPSEKKNFQENQEIRLSRIYDKKPIENNERRSRPQKFEHQNSRTRSVTTSTVILGHKQQQQYSENFKSINFEDPQKKPQRYPQSQDMEEEIMMLKTTLQDQKRQIKDLQENLKSSNKKIHDQDLEKQQQMLILQQLENDVQNYQNEYQEQLDNRNYTCKHLENIIQVQRNEIDNLIKEKRQLSSELNTVCLKYRDKMTASQIVQPQQQLQLNNTTSSSQSNSQNSHSCPQLNIPRIMKILNCESEDDIIRCIENLVLFKKKQKKFLDCIIDMWLKCVKMVQNNENTEISYKEAWKWIKQVIEDYYQLRTQMLAIKDGNNFVKKFVDKIQVVIQKGALRDKQIEQSINELIERNII